MKTLPLLLSLLLATAFSAQAQKATTTSSASLLAPRLDPQQEWARQQAIREQQTRLHEEAADLKQRRAARYGHGKVDRKRRSIFTSPFDRKAAVGRRSAP